MLLWQLLLLPASLMNIAAEVPLVHSRPPEKLHSMSGLCNSVGDPGRFRGVGKWNVLPGIGELRQAGAGEILSHGKCNQEASLKCRKPLSQDTPAYK